MQTETLPQVSFAVARATLPGVRSAPALEETPGVSPLMTFFRRVLDWLVAHAVSISVSVAIAYLGWLAWRRFAPPLAAWNSARRERRRESESYHFDVFARACNSGQADAATEAFWSWYACACAGDGAPDGGFAAIWGDLAAARYGSAANEASLDTTQLLKAATDWRGTRRRARQSGPPSREKALNPGRAHQRG